MIHAKKRVWKPVAKSSCVRCKIFAMDLVAVQCKKPVFISNIPIAIGMTVLKLSKCVIYKQYYRYLIPKNGSNVRLMMPDKDSFLHYTETENIYSAIRKDKLLIDFSNDDENHSLYDNTSAKKQGLYKDI